MTPSESGVTLLKKAIQSPKAPRPFGPYSQAVKAGNFVYVSGQRPVEVESGNTPSDVAGQAALVLRNVKAILAEASASMDDVVKVNIYLADLTDFDTVNEVYAQFFNEPYPARTTVGAALRGILVEMDVVAELPGSQSR